MTTRSVMPAYLRPLATFAILLCLTASLLAQTENLPPKPDRYVTDQAGVLDESSISNLNNELDAFERQTSNQIVVAIYQTLPPDAEIAQYATMTYNAWGIGQKNKDNGALLMVFIEDRKMFIATGRGLEGALPDAICKNIITQVIRPQFKAGNYAGGIQAGVDAMISASKGEYKGTGSTHADEQGSGQGLPAWVIILFIIIFIIIRMNSGFGPMIYTGGGWGGGGYRGGGGYGGGGGGGGGGFSGGGGSSAGGGAGGGW
jgi:uncharacterized protein